MLRNLTAADREEYLTMANDFYHTNAVMQPVPTAHLERTLDLLLVGSPYAEGYLYEFEGQTAGYALLALTHSQEFGGLVIWLEELYVKPEARGHGFMRELLSYIRQLHPQAKCLRLEAEPDNQKAVALYRKCGFDWIEYRSMYKKFSDFDV